MMLVYVFVCALCHVTFALQTVSDGPKILYVHKPNSDIVEKLQSLGLVDVWSKFDGNTEIIVEPENLEQVEKLLDEKEIRFKIVMDNLLDLIDAEENYLHSKRKRKKRAVEQMDWTSYHKLEDIEGYLGWLNATQHGHVNVIPVATTFEGRPVYVVKVSDPSSPYPKKKIWVEGGIHAREWISPAVTTFLLHQVATSSEFRPLLQKSEWYFVPVANPDGYAYTFKGGRARLWRKNRRITNRFLPNRCRGIDLNRNWALKWGVGASSNPCSDTYKGTNPFSEPEAEGLRKAMEAVSPLDLFITFHSYGQSILYPWGWTTEPPNNVVELSQLGTKYMDAVAHASKGLTKYILGGSADQYGLASGASDDWAYGALNTPMSYTIELRDNGRWGFLLPENQIIDTVQESTVGVYCMVSYLADTGVCAKPPDQLDVEPRRADSRSQNNNIIFEDF